MAIIVWLSRTRSIVSVSVFVNFVNSNQAIEFIYLIIHSIIHRIQEAYCHIRLSARKRALSVTSVGERQHDQTGECMPFKSRRNAGSSRSFSLRERFERHHSEVQLTARAILLE